jgi:hypothetical protein
VFTRTRVGPGNESNGIPEVGHIGTDLGDESLGAAPVDLQDDAEQLKLCLERAITARLDREAARSPRQAIELGEHLADRRRESTLSSCTSPMTLARGAMSEIETLQFVLRHLGVRHAQHSFTTNRPGDVLGPALEPDQLADTVESSKVGDPASRVARARSDSLDWPPWCVNLRTVPRART